MKKLLSLSLAIVMMLSCLLVQTVAVSAADAVEYTNAPYAGVYAVTSDVATTVTTEIGSVTELAAGETGYMYLIKGANEVEITNGATLTVTDLDDNGLSYLDQVNIPNEPVLFGQEDEVAANLYYTLAPGESYTFTYTPSQGLNGIVYPYLYFGDTVENTYEVISDTGFITTIYKPNGYASTLAWSDAAKAETALLYIRSGAQEITIKNIGSNTGMLNTIKIHSVGEYQDFHGVADLTPMTLAQINPTPEPTATPTPTPTAAPADDIVVYNAELAGVYEVSSDKDVTITNENGSTATLAAGETKYIYLIAGDNNITTTDTAASLTFTRLANNGLDYIDEIETAYICYGEEHVSVDFANDIVDSEGAYSIGTNANGQFIQMAAGTKVTFKVTMAASGKGIIYPYLGFKDDSNENTFRVSSDTGFYADVYKKAGSGSFTWNDADNVDMEFLYMREGVNYITIEVTGSNQATMSSFRISMTGGEDSLADHATWGPQMNLANLKPLAEEILADTDATVSGDVLTFCGKIGADYLNLAYGVEFTANKTGTRAQKYYGAKPGDTVSDGNGGITTFTFDNWDGTFEIILKGVSEGVKEYKFFVGDNYTEAATVEVVAE